MNNSQKSTFFMAYLWSGLWLSISEVVRYFGFVMPVTQESFSMIPNVAPMNIKVFALWDVWMLLLTGAVVYAYWLHAKTLGHTLKTVVIAATFSWTLFFVLFWFGNINMGLAHVSTATIALPWAWLEVVLTCWIARHFLSKVA